MSTALRADGLTKRYGRRTALEDCTLEVPAGRVVGLVVVVLGVAGIVMAYRPEATEYMRLKAWERAARR